MLRAIFIWIACNSFGSYCAPLPIPAEINARLVMHRQSDKAVNLKAVWLLAMILAPCGLLREPNQVQAGNMMMMADFAAPHPREETLGVVRMRLGFIA